MKNMEIQRKYRGNTREIHVKKVEFRGIFGVR